MMGARRFKVHISTPTTDYWSEAIAADGMYAALAKWARLASGLPADLRPDPARPQGWHLAIVPEESWPSLERELELILQDPPF